ncbi:cytochrome c [Bordetella holmesii]|uniref:Cytochrome C n=2 Tax=Bordetella holmesii TaxID=35814 RepID=A0A158M678_9BORD|nr:cytochrome c [Bordetella holmesii]AHV94903.1 cytochrome c family protein [Bordetella holmesii ATCC 51541]AIT25585.1 cytochrome c family protein [Bordetella holmesii 44057]EWM46153.1 cytochrome c family protein [Bordetella holmesii 35009]EWM50309.1 cytochrome c family protein [Bordetella holmesii 70147]AMD44745.1 cytochrome C [Bordetella holmesii H558]
MKRLLLTLALALASTGAHANDNAQRIERGRTLAIAADCMACHTRAPSGKPFAGGYPIQSPLGTIYASNITPSKSAGIGDYSLEDFTRAVRQGIRRDGSRLYPAMPYTSYTLITDEDIGDLYAYFMNGVQAVDDKPPSTDLPFPFGIRASMLVWNALFFDDERFTPDPTKDAEINRGAYLARALTHCSSCHTPRNALMAEDVKRPLGGGMVGPWHAPNISSDPAAGIGGWSNEEIVQYLRTGRVAGKGQAAGSMAEAVEHSFQHMSETDLTAIAAWLKQTPPVPAASAAPASYARGAAASAEAQLRGTHPQTANHTLKTGAALYSAYCASCHQASGTGSTGQAYPALFHNTATGADNANNLVAAILYGVERNAAGQHVLMPRFDQKSYVQPLTNNEIALIANYVLANYGNPVLTVTAEDVQVARSGGAPPLLARMQPYILPALIVAAVLVLLGVFVLVRRRRRG